METAVSYEQDNWKISFIMRRITETLQLECWVAFWTVHFGSMVRIEPPQSPVARVDDSNHTSNRAPVLARGHLRRSTPSAACFCCRHSMSMCPHHDLGESQLHGAWPNAGPDRVIIPVNRGTTTPTIPRHVMLLSLPRSRGANAKGWVESQGRLFLRWIAV
jgi:hypothetical protein